MAFVREDNSFSEGSYYSIDCPRDSDYLRIQMIGGELRAGRITSDESLWFGTAMVVRRTARTVTFRVPLLGKDIRVWTGRTPVWCMDNEIAEIRQTMTENGMIKGLTTYPHLTIMAYDELGNNHRLNTEWKGTLDRLYGREATL